MNGGGKGVCVCVCIKHKQLHSTYIKNSIILFFFVLDLKKNFEQSPYSVNVEMEHQTQLRCIPPQGIPPPKVYWLKNGAVLEPDSNIIISSEGHLIFSEARFQDTANYTCVAENLANKRFSDSALLKVIGKFFFIFFSLPLLPTNYFTFANIH